MGLFHSGIPMGVAEAPGAVSSSSSSSPFTGATLWVLPVLGVLSTHFCLSISL